MFYAKNFIGLRRLSRFFSGHFGAIHSWSVRRSRILQKNHYRPVFGGGGVQGRSRSSMLINLKSPSPVLVMIISMYVPICNRFHTEPIAAK